MDFFRRDTDTWLLAEASKVPDPPTTPDDQPWSRAADHETRSSVTATASTKSAPGTKCRPHSVRRLPNRRSSLASCQSAPSTRVSRIADQNTRRARSHQCILEAKGPRSPCPTCHTLPDTSPINGRLRLPIPAARHIATRRHLPWQGLSLLTPAAVALAPPRPVAWRHCRPTRVQVQSHVTHLGYSVADPTGSPRAPEPAKGPYK
ncbi:hypothetical protein TIFTF001_046924 [Ficus carica]|uniref:Uncharacterized protein n=1 Tax=Ficus carica TaxID=3494 RepID=A0AA87Z5H2_FICCA|nr:hypothetical protein TIFTF001_046924 [Ficus carica]